MNMLLSWKKQMERIINQLLSKLSKLRNRHWLILDIVIFAITPFLSLLLTYNHQVQLQEYSVYLGMITALFLAIKLMLFWRCGFYKRYWHYASIEEIMYIVILFSATVIIETIILSFLAKPLNSILDKLPGSLLIIEGLISCSLVILLRFSWRLLERIIIRQSNFHDKERALIIGAGSAGITLVEDMQRNPRFGFKPVGFIDDDRRKLHIHIRGIPVLGDRYKIPEVVESLKINKIIISMPSVSGKEIKEIVNICQGTGIKTSTLPGLQEMINDQIKVHSIRDIRIEDLLRREPIEIDIDKVSRFLENKTVLITGSGGSIGSELCRQILQCQPKNIILVGHGENSVFNIQQELEQLIKNLHESHKLRRNKLNISAFIADIRVYSRLEQIFDKCQPDIIFHAAAHKHVPLMELNPTEAITNNVRGTKNLLAIAIKYNIKHFVMISTDKAVNPTNIMGASKRVAEMLVLQAAKDTGNNYVAVRFGNVLGSRGSVVPTFKKQIEVGGPITVTHPDITRYFMTIPEAVQLVLQASVMGHSGEILMLNMGKPVKIVDLAKELIRLSGYEVNKDIEIVFTKLRPGEKLFEELFVEGEEYEKTEHEKLLIVKNASQVIPENLGAKVEILLRVAGKNDANLIKFLLEQLVLGYKPEYLVSNNLLEVNKFDNHTSNTPVNILGNIESQSA
ncbi:polysaccharide biosynthesis protein [Anabaena sp. FACHB-1237]|uniref:polysaccharide biosynthesis protein n=1 Tax=Anabaena sp. FACHB-1237 TaxID=2692769 RepID=UPI0016809BC5|nr:nucleoside-diphosphate sugar epimerase/dehydratase [Anabaena sp. FACHB-1237]MBD2138463.1 polysaccharide biosynthesis protein [Anabaena sp. FACHB-1237]